MTPAADTLTAAARALRQHAELLETISRNMRNTDPHTAAELNVTALNLRTIADDLHREPLR